MLINNACKQKSFAESSSGLIRTGYFLSGEMHLDVRIHQVSVFSDEGLLDISHDAGVHLGKPLSAVDFHIILSPLPLCWDTLWEQEVSAYRHKPVGLLIYLLYITVYNALLRCILDSLPLYVIIISLVGFVWGLDIVTLPDHGDVTLDITFTPGGDVIRVRQDGPLMIKLVFWERRQSIRPML